MQPQMPKHLAQLVDPDDKKKELAIISQMEGVRRTMNSCEMEMQKLQQQHSDLMDDAVTRGKVILVHAPKQSNLVMGVN